MVGVDFDQPNWYALVNHVLIKTIPSKASATQSAGDIFLIFQGSLEKTFTSGTVSIPGSILNSNIVD